MHGCTSGSLLLVNAEIDSMGGAVDGGVEISSVPSLQQSSDLEKTQAELRQTFSAVENFRRELEFLQRGGDPLDLKTGTTVSLSVQSTSLTDQHPEQFVTSEVKGSFAVTASPHGDSFESSGRLGALSAGEPTSADNLMLFDGDNKFREVKRKYLHRRANNSTPSENSSHLNVHNAKESGESAALELPKKSYKRRIRSRANRDGARSNSTDASPRGAQPSFPFRHASRDAKKIVHDEDNRERNNFSNSKSKPKTLNASVAPKNLTSNSRLDVGLNGLQTVNSTLGTVPSSPISDTNASQHPLKNLADQHLASDTRETPFTMASVKPESLGAVEQEKLSGSHCPPSVDGQTADYLDLSGHMKVFGDKGERKSTTDANSGARVVTRGLDSESSCTQTEQILDCYNGNESPNIMRILNSNGAMKQNLASNEALEMEGNILNIIKDDKMSNIANDNSNPYHPCANDNGFTLKEEEGLKGSESALLNDLKNLDSAKGVDSDGCTASGTERKPCIVLGSNSTSRYANACTDKPSAANCTLSVRPSIDGAEQNGCSENSLKLATKEREDKILEEARIIEAKRKRIAGLSVGRFPLEIDRKSHWDFVLEEMSWLANDFAQERLWKVTAAAQISRRAAFTSLVRFQQENSLRKQKEVAHTLAEAVLEFWHTMQVKSSEGKLESLKQDSALGLQGYATRFLEYNSSHAQYSAAQAPTTPDRISDLGIIDISWEDNLTEENLFYTVPPGAIEAYRKSIESHLLQVERTGSSMQEEVDISGYNAVADNAFEEDEGETSTYYLPGTFESSKSSKPAQKKRKHIRSYGSRFYEMGADSSFMQSVERNIGTQPSVMNGKRPGSSINVSIPVKRVRTASRQRVLSPFNPGTSGCIQAPNRTDASSGDTNSFQDEQSFLHGGSHVPNNMEAESVGDYEKQLQFDSMEVSNRPKKKKKAKHPGSTFEQRWQHDSFQNDQKDHSRGRLDTHQFNSNGNSVASQMSNMSNPNKFMKLLVRDRAKKAKSLKIPAGQPGAESPWSLFEDQALVVLVHDMGPNWELISDAINSTLQFKCISRKSKECKERHKILMDRNTGDGADSAEDSGSSQPYPSTLPGIPEGSARQLFQRLQGPMEEDTLKSHFEKIIMIGQKQHYRRTQNDIQDPKQLQQPHSSHTLALSQVCPNNLSGGPILTPPELCDAISSTPDFLPVGYQGPQSGGLPIPNQGTVAPILPGSGSTSSMPGSPNVVLGSHLPSVPAALNPAVRDGRYGVSRTGPLPVDDQQRMQQYNQMLSARNMHPSGLPPGSHPGTDRGVRMGVMSGVNRNMTIPRPGFQLNSGSVLSSGPGQGNLIRPREPMHVMRPKPNTDLQRQVLAPELPMQQASQGGGAQGVGTPFASGMNSFPNPNAQLPVQSYPMPPQRSPHMQHPAYGMRFFKERQLQQQRLLKQQHFSPTTAMVPPHAPPPPPPQSQIPVSPPQSSVPHHPQKHPVPTPQGLVRNPQTAAGGNTAKPPQRQRPPPPFQRPQQRQQPPSHQQPAVHHLLQKQKPSPPPDTSNNRNQRMVHIRQVNSSDPPKRKPPPPPVPSGNPSESGATVSPPCDGATGETPVSRTSQWKMSDSFYDSSGAMVDNPMRFGKVSVGMSPPQTSSGSEHSEPAVNHGGVHRQSSSDSLPTSVGQDGGVQWQQKPSS